MTVQRYAVMSAVWIAKAQHGAVVRVEAGEDLEPAGQDSTKSS